MSEKRVIIGHKDGREYSVTPAAFEKLYEPEGFKVLRDESDGDFIADVPRKPVRAGARRKSAKVGGKPGRVETPAAAAAAPEPPITSLEAEPGAEPV